MNHNVYSYWNFHCFTSEKGLVNQEAYWGPQDTDSRLSLLFATSDPGALGELFTFGMSLVTRSRPTVCDPVDCSPPGSSVRRIFQARILEQVASTFSRGSSQPRDRTCVSCIGREILHHWATVKPQYCSIYCYAAKWFSYSFFNVLFSDILTLKTKRETFKHLAT